MVFKPPFYGGSNVDKPGSTREVAGTYRLLSFEIHQKDGIVRQWSAQVHGTLIYSAEGTMAVSINGDRRAASNHPAEGLLASILSYAGTYSVENGVIRHQVTEASDPERIGKEMVRDARWVSNDELELAGSGDFGRAVLIWKRKAKSS